MMQTMRHGSVIALSCLVAALAGCEHERLRVSGETVMGPGYRFPIPGGMEAVEPDAQAKQAHGRLVLLRAGDGREIAQHDDDPLSQPDAAQCERDAGQAAADAGATASSVAIVEASFGPVCSFHLESPASHAAVRMFRIMLDGATVTCTAGDADAAERACDDYLAGFRKPSWLS